MLLTCTTTQRSLSTALQTGESSAAAAKRIPVHWFLESCLFRIKKTGSKPACEKFGKLSRAQSWVDFKLPKRLSHELRDKNSASCELYQGDLLENLVRQTKLYPIHIWETLKKKLQLNYTLLERVKHQ